MYSMIYVIRPQNNCRPRQAEPWYGFAVLVAFSILADEHWCVCRPHRAADRRGQGDAEKVMLCNPCELM